MTDKSLNLNNKQDTKTLDQYFFSPKHSEGSVELSADYRPGLKILWWDTILDRGSLGLMLFKVLWCK